MTDSTTGRGGIGKLLFFKQKRTKMHYRLFVIIFWPSLIIFCFVLFLYDWIIMDHYSSWLFEKINNVCCISKSNYSTINHF